MSTVVFRDGVVAADSLMVQGSIKCPEGMSKAVFGSTHPVIYAMAGRTAALAATVRLIEAMPVAPWDGASYPTTPPLDGNCELAVFHRDGRIISIEADGLWFEPADVPFMALGSGAKAALGALHMGADATRAVEVAGLVDSWSGGRIVTLRVADIGRADQTGPDIASLRQQAEAAIRALSAGRLRPHPGLESVAVA